MAVGGVSWRPSIATSRSVMCPTIYLSIYIYLSRQPAKLASLRSILAPTLIRLGLQGVRMVWG